MNQQKRPPLPPALEQKWSDEVRYLHSLWHIGPPSSSNPNPKSKPQPTNLGPSSSSIQIQKPKKKKKHPHSTPNPPLQPISDTPWPAELAPEPPQSGWGSGWSTSSLTTTRPATAHEQAKFTAFQLQEKGLILCEEFFYCSDSEDDEDSMDEDSMDEDEVDKNTEEFEFFLGVFKEDSELRSYYEKNYENGMFCCLVCWGNRQKLNKKFKNCVALVQHSTAICKTKWKRAHRAYAKVVCKVLGWDVNRLPSIVLSVDDTLGRELESEELEETLKEHDDNGQKKDLDENREIFSTPQIGSKENDGTDQNNNINKELAETAGMDDGAAGGLHG